MRQCIQDKLTMQGYKLRVALGSHAGVILHATVKKSKIGDFTSTVKMERQHKTNIKGAYGCKNLLQQAARGTLCGSYHLAITKQLTQLDKSWLITKKKESSCVHFVCCRHFLSIVLENIFLSLYSLFTTLQFNAHHFS